ncbi:putative aldouronate transport system substrate-binding protein [Paenibacillus phyllosphaerae]|uniref:Putative aldouronate transport system substrate-binding protein n=1 Tax=Paenibacillus phyllosphaerae TaxID=274593 RepID=A0A7W5FNU0_9BACL|nr:extracellular solute-binding protein [Paenibacillus phyllosphaerae]MBB3111507.1 putative aldouronate transport system substrate-binding protein [Paenibacillus phyllosphaerae]
MRMHMIAKRSGWLLLLAMILVTSACGDDAAGVKEASAPLADDGQRYTITWTMHLNEAVPEDAEMIRYLEDKFNVDLVVWNLENNNYEALLDLKLAKGEIPDLFRIRQPNDLLKYQDLQVLAEIPLEMLNTHAPNLTRTIDANAPGYMELGKIEGSYYGIPVVNPSNKFRIPVVYRSDWLDNLGLKPPTTLEEFEKVIYAFTFQDPDGNGKNDTYGLSSEGMNVVFGAFGQMVFTEQLYFAWKDQRLVIGALQPEMKNAIAYLQRWYKDGVIDPEFVTGENKGGYKHLSHAFINGRIGMTSMGNYYHWTQAGDYLTFNARGEEVPVEASFNALELVKKNSKAKIVFGPPVTGPEGKSGSKAYDMLMSFTAIGANAAKDPGKMARILEILDYVSANPDLDENMSMKYGVQGEHWMWAGTSKDDVVILPPYNERANYTNQIGANIGMTVPDALTGRREQWASTLGLDKNGIYNAMQVSFPALIKYSPELIKLRNKAYISMITGDRPVADFDTFVQEFNAAGGDQVVEDANVWYQSQAKE